MKIFLSLLLLLLGVNSFAQKIKKIEDASVTLSSGKEIKVGDTFYFTEYPKSKAKYDYAFDDKKVSYKMSNLYITETNKPAYAGKPLKIKAFFKKEEVIYFSCWPSILPSYVEIENALDAGEIRFENELDKIQAPEITSTFLSDSLMFMEYILREPEVTENMAKEFFVRFNRDKYNFIRDDEFKYHKAIAQFKKEVKAMTPKSLEYYTIMSNTFGRYDFDKEGFHFINKNSTGLTSSSYSSEGHKLIQNDMNKEGVKFTNIEVKFTNQDDFNFLPLSGDAAQLFIAGRKDNLGNINRKIYFVTHFNVIEMDTKGEKKYFIAEINKIDVYQDFFGRQLSKYMGTIVKPTN
ncbi:DUF4852 domain-containing protein [Flammeovirga sp. OC4]|uniref:DUF4852 domain-containing protein n=1 Tax=Flammeovirga sp. OC4 TaxID=1382345 RepID=UPI0005C4AC78|nr:DUF4852 domain-containing protein [Flammeovirga sp. OC4]